MLIARSRDNCQIIDISADTSITISVLFCTRRRHISST